MIKIAVVEDEDKWANLINEYLDRFSEKENLDIAITRFRDGYDLVEGYSGEFSIIFMDIEMSLMNGMEAAEEIRKVDEEVAIVFVTNMAQYAISGYKVNALDYVLKPISYIPFCETLKRAIRTCNKDQAGHVVINYKGGTRKLSTDDIAYVESQGHRLFFNTLSEQYETTTYSMKEIETMLKEYNFRRCNSGCLVNLRYVTGYQGNEVMVNDISISISRGRKSEFMSALTSYMTE